MNSTATGLIYSCAAEVGKTILDVDVSSTGVAYWVDYIMSEGGCLRKGSPATLTTLKCFSDKVLNAVDHQSGISVWVTGFNTAGNTDAFVAKLGLLPLSPATPCEGCVVYSTTFGGSGTDYGKAIYVTPGGTAWVAGNTTSANLPNAANSHGGGMDGFVVKLGPGVPTTSRYIGGSAQDTVHSIVVRSEMVSVIPYVVGGTHSANFPSTPGVGGPCAVGSSGGNPHSGFIWRGPSINPGWSGCIGGGAAGVGLSDVGTLRIHVAGAASSNIPLQPPPTIPPFSSDGYGDAFLVLFKE